MIRVLGKFTVWEAFQVPSALEERFLEFLKENPKATYHALVNWFDANDLNIPYREFNMNRVEFLESAENGGSSTTIVRRGDPFTGETLHAF